MGTFRDLIVVLLMFLSVTCIVYPELLHNILVYFYKTEKYNTEYIPYYTVIGIILGLTAAYFTSSPM